MCGKTRTAVEHATSVLYMGDPAKIEDYLMLAVTSPSTLLEGDTPRLIDEWQVAPRLWNGVRFEVDQRGLYGQFILTGSAVPVDDPTLHTGTGRITRILMRPMTLFESLESSGDVSMNSLFNGDEIKGKSPLTIKDIAFALLRGGWPASVKEKGPAALTHARNYVKAVMNTDVSRVDGVKKSPARVRKLLHSLARNTSTTANLKTVMADIDGEGTDGIKSDKTVTAYMNALQRLFVTEDIPAWGPHMRSKVPLRSHNKRHFIDPSIAAAILRISPEGLLNDFNTFGLLFESLCVRDIRVYAQALDGEVYHYRDKNGLEADVIIHLYDGRGGAIEIKMGSNEIEKAVKNLIKLRDKIDLDEMGEPSFLAVITAGEYAYRRNDGIYIVPIGCLKD